jgi:glycosyltransferase involved in cell wall biosynthesis
MMGGGVGAYEIIVVDDGSTDGGGDIVAEMAQKNPRIRLIRQKNAGSGASRNIGIDIACGKYIYFVDADDVLVPNSMATNLDFMDCHNLEALNVQFGDANPDEVEQLLSQLKHHEPLEYSDVISGVQFLKDTNMLTSLPHSVELWRVIFRLDVFRRNDVRSTTGKAQDMLLNVEAITNVQRMACSNLCTYIYVNYPNSTYHQRYSYDNLIKRMIPYAEGVHRIRKKYHDLYCENGLMQYFDMLTDWMCFSFVLWPMVRECVSPKSCRRDIAKFRNYGIYPIGMPSSHPIFSYRSNRVLNYLWLLSRHYYLWMALITVNHLLRKAPAVEAHRVGR